MDKTQIILQLSRYEDSLEEIRYAKFFNELKLLLSKAAVGGLFLWSGVVKVSQGFNFANIINYMYFWISKYWLFVFHRQLFLKCVKLQ